MARTKIHLTAPQPIECQVPGLSRIDHMTIDPRGRTVAVVTDSGHVYAYDIPTGEWQEVSLETFETFTKIAAGDGFVVVYNSKTLEVHELNSDGRTTRLQRTDPFVGYVPDCCSLSINAQLIGAISHCRVTVYNRFQLNTPPQTWKESKCKYISFSPDGTTTFLLSGQLLLACNTLTGYRRAVLRVDHEWYKYFQVASDETTDHVAVADSKSLRVWNVNNPHLDIKTLPYYSSPNLWILKQACAISRDGSRVVAAVSGFRCFIWDTITCTRIAILDTEMYRYACIFTPEQDAIITISADVKLFTQKDFKIRTWKLPVDTQAQPAALTRTPSSSSNTQENNTLTITSLSLQSENYATTRQSTETSLTPSNDTVPEFTVLEHAFVELLSNPTLLDLSFILDHISAHNVNTASDLLAGHNIILLAIRVGVITRDNIHTIGGSSWYLQDNLYLPASKLTQENGDLLDAIFYHAESLGIVKDGNKYKMAREIRSDMHNNLQSVGQAVRDVAQRLCDIEQRVGFLDTGMQNINGRVNQMALNEQKLQEAVIGLSGGLKQLQKSMCKCDKRTKYAAVAKCLLSFIPVVGQAVGEVAVTAAELFMNFSKKDVVSVRLRGVHSIATQVAQVDLSNLQVARYAFSRKIIDQLALPARDAVMSSVLVSGFESAEEVEKVFIGMTSDTTADDEPTALLDIGSSTWLCEPCGAAAAGSSSQAINSLDEQAQKYFQYVCVNRERELSIEETKVELNKVLERCHGLQGIDGDSVENMFFDIAAEDAEVVSEELFVEMFRRVRIDQEKENALIEGCRQRFRKRADPKTYLSIRMAARLLSNIEKGMADRGIVRTRKYADADFAAQVMRSADVDESGNIDEGEFMSAVEALLEGSEG